MDVERTLGPQPKTKLTYYFPDVVVYFDFSSNPKCQQNLSYTSWDVPENTATGIDVTLRHPKKVEQIGIDLTKYEKIKGDYDLVDHYYYSNTDDGSELKYVTTM
jgi:hypothetical protein